MPNKKNNFEFFLGCIWTMIKFLIIFFSQYFQEKKVIQWLESPLSIKGFKVQSFSQILFSHMNEMDKK